MTQGGGSSFKAYFDLMRPLNCIMGGLATILALFIALEGDIAEMGSSPILVAQGFSIAFLFTLAGNSLNDYFDRDVDMENHPNRPIPRGDMKPHEALLLSAAVFVILVIWSWFITYWAFVIVSSSAVIMVMYEVKLKSTGLPGNISISWLTGCAFLFGGSVVNQMETVAIMALLAFFASVGREILKDIEDMGGDKNRKTLPMRIGPKGAAGAASFGFVSAVALSPLPFIFGMMGFLYILPVILANVIFIYSAVLGFSAPSKAQRTAKLGMLFGLLAFFTGTIGMI